ncbi:MAG: hypothetical protein U0931_38315 [Vulcanimicrobiota bacterium]
MQPESEYRLASIGPTGDLQISGWPQMPPLQATYPSLSPDGRAVAFEAESKIWLCRTGSQPSQTYAGCWPALAAGVMSSPACMVTAAGAIVVAFVDPAGKIRVRRGQTDVDTGLSSAQGSWLSLSLPPE